MSLGYCDVCRMPDGALAFVVSLDDAIVARDRWSVPIRRQWLDLRCGILDWSLVAVGKESDPDGGTVWITVDGAPVWDAGQAFGTNSVCVGKDGIYICRSPTRIDVISIAGVLLRTMQASVGSQGIRDVTPEGELRLGDQWLTRVRRGLTLYQPMERDGVMVGQADPAQIAGDGPQGLFTALSGFSYEPHISSALADGRHAICARTPAGPQCVLVPPYPPLVTVAPPRLATPPGPRSEVRPADGTVYDLSPFIFGDADLWPRKGPTHPMHQHRNGTVFSFVKFGDIAPDGSSFETWALDKQWVYILVDASSGNPYSFSDPRWFPRHMRIGETFDTGEHRKIVRRRGTCQVLADDPFRRLMSLLAVYPSYYWGPDLGERETSILVYDPTGGVHTPDRGIELYYGARGAGLARWEYHDSSLVYANGGRRFDDTTRKARSDFYLLGGPAIAPKVSDGCVAHVIPIITSPPPHQEPPPMSSGPSLDQWANVELPQLIAKKAEHLGIPDWGKELLANDRDLLKVVAIWNARRYNNGLPPGEWERDWNTFQKILNYEANPEGH